MNIVRPKSVQNLPVDVLKQNFPRKIVNAIFATLPVQPLAEPLRVLAVSPSALKLIGVDAKDVIPILSGQISAIPNLGFLGWAHCYWGSQFGAYAGQLGDGAAALIGEANGFEINLKGTGKTPFSRGFDGRKVLRSSLREFLASEAMAGLGIPTTRAGSLIVSESEVPRDISYSGNQIGEKCAVISRIAKTFFRFGSFESFDNSPVIRNLFAYVEGAYMPGGGSDEERVKTFMTNVIDKTAFLVAEWQSVGFVHGVMNTDNMSIIGDTIDYGPFGFVENYDPHFVPNTSDKFGRYAFSEQPRMAAWNCQKLASVLAFHFDTITPNVEEMFYARFNLYYEAKMHQKIGTSKKVVREKIFAILEKSAVDYTTVFYQLVKLSSEADIEEIIEEIMSTYPSVERIQKLSASTKISAADLPEIERFAETRLNELEKAGIDLQTIARWKFHINRVQSFVSRDVLERKEECRTEWREFLTLLAPLLTEEARTAMKKVNPIYIPRQGLMQKSIEDIQERNDTTELHKLLQIFSNPFDIDPNIETNIYAKPTDSADVCLSCSS